MVEVSLFHSKRRTTVAREYRYQELGIATTTKWLGGTVPDKPRRHPETRSGHSVQRAICQAEVPMGMLSCPRCRARFHYSLRLTDEAPAKIGKATKERADRNGNQGRVDRGVP